MEIRIVCPLAIPVTLKSGVTPPPILSVMTVVLVPAPKVPVPVFGVPAPMTEMPTPEILTPEVQVQDPDGILIVSPFTALCVGPLMTALTSLWLQDAAVTVLCAFAIGPQRPTTRATRKHQFFILNTGEIPFETI